MLEGQSSYKSKYGYAAHVGIENVKVDRITFRFTLGFEKYGGELEASEFGMSYSSKTKANVDKSVISLGIFPLNFKLFKKIDLNFGFEMAALINENYSGTISGWTMPNQYWSSDLEGEYSRFNSKFYFGLRGRVAYDIKISEQFIISPQYSFYCGFMNEFDEYPQKTKSFRNYLGIGIQRKLKL